MSNISTLKLSQLSISPKNVRVVNASKKDDAQLIASIRARGILQNLVVVPAKSQAGTYEVVAGGRRFAALNLLCTEGAIEDAYPVPCAIASAENATELSLSENIKAPMHPADEFLAFKALTDAGQSVPEIATHFGRAKAEVKRLLKLGDLAPVLVDHFRAGKLDLDAMMAFTVCADQAQQEACYKELSRACRLHSRTIKQFLLDDTVDAQSAEAKFVGVRAYKLAGGTVTADLFSGDSYWDNTALVHRLIADKLQQRAASYQKDWAWVEVSRLGYGASQGLTRITPTHVGVPAKLEEKLASIEARLSALNELDDWTEAEEHTASELEQQAIKLEEKKDGYLQFSAAQRALAGVVVTYDSHGDWLVLPGLVRAADKARLAALEQNSSAENEDGVTPSVAVDCAAPVESRALQNDLRVYYQQAFQAHLLQHEAICLDVLVYSLAYSFFHHGTCRGSVSQIQCHDQNPETVAAEQTPPAERLQQAALALNLAWIQIREDGPRFAAFQALSKKEKTAILVFCTARSCEFGLGETESSQQTGLAQQTAFNVADYWLPNAENYFSRIRRDDLLAIGVALTDERFAETHQKLKKGELVSLIQGLPERQTWLPAVMTR